MNISKYTLTGLLCMILVITLASAAIVSSAARDFGEPTYVFLLMLLMLAILAPLLNFLHRDKFRAGGIVLSVVFLLIWGSLALLIAGWVSSRWFSMLMMLMITAVPGGIALLMRTKPWGRIFAWVLSGFSIICTLMGQLGVWLELETLLYYAMILMIHGTIISMLLINVGRGDRRYFRWPGVALAVVAILLSLRIFTGAGDEPDLGRYRSMFISELCGIAAGTLALINVMVMTRRPGLIRFFQISTILLTALTGVLLVPFMIVWEIGSDRLTGAPGAPAYVLFLTRSTLASMILATGSLLALFVTRAMLRIAQQPVPFAAERVQITCPNCGTSALMPLKGKCPKCLLEIRIVLSEPRCPTCQYLQLNLESSRCTECGTPIERPPTVSPPLPSVAQ